MKDTKSFLIFSLCGITIFLIYTYTYITEKNMLKLSSIPMKPKRNLFSRYRITKPRTNPNSLKKFNLKPQGLNHFCRNITLKLSQVNRTALNSEELDGIIRESCSGNEGYCKVENLIGPLHVNTTQIALQVLYQKELPFVRFGGWWSPKNCTKNTSTAIIIPFRDRHKHLPLLLRQLHPILRRQQLHYRIFVIEQEDKSGFNRAKLLNIGFNEALKIFPYNCFVFHDVDLVPENDKISYGCKYSPMHMSVAIDKFRYKLPYGSIFGGIEMMHAEHFKKINGFNNIFYSWGGEDDIMYERVRNSGFKIHRQSAKVARYTMLKHVDLATKRSVNQKKQTELIMRAARKHHKDDGLTNLQYRVNNIVAKKLYTLIQVDLQKEKENGFGIKL